MAYYGEGVEPPTEEELEAAAKLLEPVYERARARAAARAAGLPVLLDERARRRYGERPATVRRTRDVLHDEQLAGRPGDDESGS